MIGQTVSHYRILEKLGEGGMGIVYLAEDTILGRRVAIKFLTTARDNHHYRARFLQEARSASALSHPHIAAIYDYGETPDNHPFIVMELVQGRTLADLMLGGELTIARAVEIIEDVAEALIEAHQHQIIHRDIKPSNIAVNDRQQVKVLDFGLAKQLSEDFVPATSPDAQTLLATRTREGVVIGTPLYLSPEQARGDKIDARSDLFSLGSVLYEALAGRPAFYGASVIEICAQVLHVEPAKPSIHNAHVPPELDLLTIKALAKSPDERYQSASEFADALRTLRPKLQGAAQQTRTQHYPLRHDTSRVKALGTVSHAFRQPRVMLSTLLLIFISVLSAWFVLKLWPHRVPHDSIYWFDEGVKAIHDGTYFKASQALTKAVQVDPEFSLGHARLAEAWTELDYTSRAKDEMMTAQALLREQLTLPALLLQRPSDRLLLEAIDATIRRDFAGAVKSYEEITRLTPDEPHAYVDLGRAYEKNDQINQALENYSKATQLNQNYAAPYLHQGILYSRQKDFRKADDAFKQADHLYNAMSNMEGITEVHYQRGFLLNKRDVLPEARIELQKALALARENSENKYQQIQTLLQLSSVSYSESQTVEAETLANEAINLADKNRMPNLAARGLIDLGNTFLKRNNLKEAQRYFDKALDLANLDGGGRNKARALLSLASLSLQKNKPEATLEYVSQALPFYQAGGYAQESSQALQLKAQAQSLKGEYEAARQIFAQQLEAAIQADDRSQAAVSHEGLGSVLAFQEQYPEAEKHFTASYELYHAIGSQLSAGYSLLSRANTLWRLGSYEDAHEVLKQASAIADQPDGSNQQLHSGVNLIQSLIALSKNDYKGAAQQSKQVINESCADDFPTCVEARNVYCLAQIKMNAKSKEALHFCHEAGELARRTNDPRLLSQSQLAVAEVLLIGGETQGAFENAISAQKTFDQGGQLESAWRVWLIMAQVSAKNGEIDKATQYAVTARQVLAQLQEKWGPDVFAAYLNRPDIHWRHGQLLSIASSHE